MSSSTLLNRLHSYTYSSRLLILVHPNMTYLLFVLAIISNKYYLAICIHRTKLLKIFYYLVSASTNFVPINLSIKQYSFNKPPISNQFFLLISKRAYIIAAEVYHSFGSHIKLNRNVLPDSGWVAFTPVYSILLHGALYVQCVVQCLSRSALMSL